MVLISHPEPHFTGTPTLVSASVRSFLRWPHQLSEHTWTHSCIIFRGSEDSFSFWNKHLLSKVEGPCGAMAVRTNCCLTGGLWWLLKWLPAWYAAWVAVSFTGIFCTFMSYFLFWGQTLMMWHTWEYSYSFLLKKIYYFYFVCVKALPENMYMYHMHTVSTGA